MNAVSVLIPAFNRSQLLARAVRSVLNQTSQDFEVIVIDDGSTDDTAQIVKSLGPRVKYIWQENQGVAVARNTGINNANGKYISFLDSDDEFHPNHLELLLKKFDLNPDASIIHGWAQIIDQDGRRYQRNKSKLHGITFRDFLFSNPAELGTLMFKCECFEDDALFDPSLIVYEDWDLWLRLSFRYKFDFVSRTITTIHYQDTRRSSECSAEQVGEVVHSMYAKLMHDPISNDLLRPYRQRLEANIHIQKGHHYRIYEGNSIAARREFLKAISISPFFERGIIGLLESFFGQNFTHTMRILRSNIFSLRK